MEKLKTVKRTINYFEITIDLNEDKDLNDFIEVFTKIRNLSVNKSPERFVKNNDKQLYLNGISIDEKLERVSGKLLNIRMENFPELMNTIDDVVRDIEAEEAEGIIETSHFILSRSEEHTSELQSRPHLVCRLLLEKKNKIKTHRPGQSYKAPHFFILSKGNNAGKPSVSEFTNSFLITAKSENKPHQLYWFCNILYT